MAISASNPAKSKKMTVASVLKRIETEGIRWIDLQFLDVLGALQHITIPSTSLGAEEFKRGVGKLDGSSIKGFKEIHESDMVWIPIRPRSPCSRGTKAPTRRRDSSSTCTRAAVTSASRATPGTWPSEPTSSRGTKASTRRTG